MPVRRYGQNPILKPVSSHPWEAQAVFNGCPVKKGDDVHLFYRALAYPHPYSTHKEFIPASCIGIASSGDGVNFHGRRQFIVPAHEWEAAGCEDPRVTYFDGRYFVFYTALAKYPPRPEDIRIGVALTKDLKGVDEKHLVTNFNSKAMALFPERIGGKVWALLTVHTDSPPARICAASFESPEEIWSESYWSEWHRNFERHSLPLERSGEDQVEVGAPPIKTEFGWLIFFSYIRKYFTQDRLFTVEAALLDPSNPTKVIAQSKYPLLVPEEYYEKVGYVPNVVFPSGALREKDQVHLYYGGADTVCCVATADLDLVLDELLRRDEVRFVRADVNPIISPSLLWETNGTFNPGAVLMGEKVHLLYRAMTPDNTSVFGYAQSGDGIHIDQRNAEPVYQPRAEFERKRQPGNSGCEDPRLTAIGGRVYVLYTAYEGTGLARVAMTWIKAEDLATMRWDWAKPVLISPPEVYDKDACIFPEQVRDPLTGERRYLIIHRIDNNMDYALVPSLEFDGRTWVDANQWVAPRKGSWDSVKVGAAAPPIKTGKGWILLYHGVDERATYRVGALLLSLENPLEVLARTRQPVFEPEEAYEKRGVVNNVVFPCGVVEMKGKVFMYYGGGDRVTGVATLETERLLRLLLTQ